MNNCPVTLTVNSLKNHLYQHQKLKANKMGSKLTCTDCNFKACFQFKFIAHFKSHNRIVCPVKNCGSSYNTFRSFKSHLLRHPPHCVPDDFKSEILGKASDLPYSDATENILNSHFELSATSL